MQPGNKPLKLTLVIPAYNEESHLKKCLDAVSKQTVQADQIILVDNNSTDATAAIASKYVNVQLLQEKRQGIVYARNAGFDAANGTLIGRIDADTVLPLTWVEDVKRFYALPENQNSCLTGSATFRNMPAPRVAGWLQKQLAFRLNRIALGHHILWGSNMVIPARVWKAVREDICPLSYIHEDIDLAIHVHKAGFQIVYHPGLRVSAVMRRVLTDRKALWPNLKWWPRTLRLHGKKTWPLTVFGAGGVYSLSLLVRLFKGRPKPTVQPD